MNTSQPALSFNPPYLFGSCAYWAKIAASVIHVVQADGFYSRAFKLAHLEVAGLSTSVPMVDPHPTLRRVKHVHEMKYSGSETARVAKGLEMALMGKKHKFGQRLEGVRDLLKSRGDGLYWGLHADVLRETAKIVGLKTIFQTEIKWPVTMEWRLQEYARLYPETELIVLGSNTEEFFDPSLAHCPVFVQTMRNPSPMSFLQTIADEEYPLEALRDVAWRQLL